MELVHARLGEDFHPTISKTVELRRERILIHADLADRVLWRQLSVGEAVDINLSAVWTGRRSGKRLEIRRQFVRIIGESIKVLALDHRCAGIVRGTDLNVSR